MQKNRKNLNSKEDKVEQIVKLFEFLGKALKQSHFYEAYHFMMVSRMSFEDTICVRGLSSTKAY